MPLNQREVIAEAIDGKRYVEWGVGGTTAWLVANANPKAAHSVEHDHKWFRKIVQKLPGWWSGRCYPIKPGQNATIGEEKAHCSDVYTQGGALMMADVYFIDGVVRAECLRALVATGRKMTIFIHDTQRDWYDKAIQEAIDAGGVRTDYPEGDDYPGCLLTRIDMP